MRLRVDVLAESLAQVVQKGTRPRPSLLKSAQLGLPVQDVINTGTDLIAPRSVDLQLRIAIGRVQAGKETVRHHSAFVRV